MLHVCQCFQVLLGVDRNTGSKVGKVGKHQNGDAQHKHVGQFHSAAEVTTVSGKIQKVKIFTSIKFDWMFQIILGEFNSTCLQVPSSGQTAT